MKGQSPSEQQKELQRAKCSMKAWTLKGRRWDYRQLCRWCTDPAGRYELLNHLREAGFFVLHPPDEHELSTLKEAAALAEEAAEEAAEPAAASADVQVSLDDPLLKSYRAHLGETLNISKSKQEIANVARWLHFLLPLSGQVSTEFVRSVAKVDQYVKNLESAQLGRATITTYIEHMLRFTAFVRERSNPEEAADCEIFIQALKSALQNLGSKDEHSRRQAHPKLVVGPATTLRRCQGVIFRAEEEMQKLQKNLDQDSHVTEEQRTRYRYYCQALLILKLCLKPSVVENLTLLETYFNKVRAGYIQGSDVEDVRFFLTRSGSAIKSAHVELSRLHRHYNLPSVSSQDVRRVLWRDATAAFPNDIALLGAYLGISEAKGGLSSRTNLSTEQVVGVACDIMQQVRSYIEQMGWTGNCVSAEEVVEHWTAPASSALEKDEELIRHVAQQSWTGLVIAESKKHGAGRGLFTTKAFPKGSILCDYHGKVVDAAEGTRVMESLKPGEASYIYFFRKGAQDLCVNSQSDPCECHPSLATFGRMINHSAKSFNVKGIVCDLQGHALPVLLFKATRDIKVGEEVYFDYGVTRRSFGGEGMGLSWLDD
ncbi:hypothetical protein GOODEAATRI_024867 [Goodea atripinnis]|uniref:SET domain-containing protein n=1 Tax=Goodea atripinnis TaxID=208336 RepID=A0ABV0NMX7_9TELE